MKVLFTGGGGAGSEAFARLFAERHEVHFADADPEARPAPIRPDRWHQIPFASAGDFVARVRALVQSIGIDVLVPGVDEELAVLAHARATLGCHLLLPPAVFVETHLDKFASATALQAAGLPAPRTVPLESRGALSYPLIVKPRSGRGSRGVAVVRSEDELQAHLVTSRRPAADFIAQQWMQGQEYTVMVAADRAGRLRAVVPVRVDIKRGITLRARTESDSGVIAACSAIHASNPVAGCYNIQLMRDTQGVSWPFEINPRISTTTCLAVAAGADFLALCMEDSGSAPPPLAAFRDGLRLQRSWYNDFLE